MSIYKVGGSKWHIAPMLSFHPQKLSKLTKTGLRWKLASLCTYMSFEIHPMFHKIFIRSIQSSPIWTEKNFLSFLSKNGEYSQYFDLHIQYLHQMKAQTILHSNLIPKMIFLTKNILKNLMQIGLSAILASNSIKNFFWNVWFLKKKFGNPKILWFSLLLNTRNEIYTKISDP